MSVLATLTVSLNNDGFSSSSISRIIATSSLTLYVKLSNLTMISRKLISQTCVNTQDYKLMYYHLKTRHYVCKLSYC